MSLRHHRPCSWTGVYGFFWPANGHVKKVYKNIFRRNVGRTKGVGYLRTRLQVAIFACMEKTIWRNEYFRPLADLIRNGKFHWDEYERTSLQFRFYGDCAVMTGELHAKGTGARFGPQHTSGWPIQMPVSAAHSTSLTST